MYEPNIAATKSISFQITTYTKLKVLSLDFCCCYRLDLLWDFTFFFSTLDRAFIWRIISPHVFGFSVWHMFLMHTAHHMWAWTPSLVQTITLGKHCTHMTKSNFLMLKNITTSTELVCSELTSNDCSNVTNLIWQENKLEKIWKGSLSKNRHSMLSEILPSLHLIP